MKTKYDYVIGIDPDVDKSGIAFLDVNKRCIIDVNNMSFPDLLESVAQATIDLNDKRLAVVIEASWRTTTNWHLSRYESSRSASKVGYNVGRNHETGRKLVEMLRYMTSDKIDVDIVEHAPLRKIWAGKERKITQREIMQFIPDLPTRMNQDARDATLLAWIFADLPIYIKPTKTTKQKC